MKKAISKLLKNPKFFKLFLNWYRPYRGAGIKITHIEDDYSGATVEMPLRWYNRNYVGTHFGGSLYSMIDPFHMLLLMNQLGKDYIVWDKSAGIEFVRPGTGTVTAHFQITQDDLNDIVKKTADGQKYLPQFSVEIKNAQGEVVARALKTLYIRKKMS